MACLMRGAGHSMMRGGAFAAIVAFGGLAFAQSDAPPRKIAPDRFPDYGVRAQGAPPKPSIDSIAATPTPPTSERPLGDCRRDMATGVWLRCLRETAGLADTALDATAERTKAVFLARDHVSEVLRRAWMKSLDESQTRWRALRDYECQQLALAEPGASQILLEARLTCVIARSLARARALTVRYRLDE